jgi:AcrR family transcriptional regulator
MPTNKETAIRSRRDRPAKPPLTREGTIAAALTILSSEGLGKVTMRRIAAELDTGPASLYVYIRNTEDLHAQILDALLTSVTAAPLPGGNWRDGLKELLIRYLRVLLDYPEMAKMAMSTLPSGPSYLSLVDAILALLKQGGVPDDEAAWAVDILLLYATAQAAEKGAWKASAQTPNDFSALATAIQEVDVQTYPNIAALGEKLLSGGGSRLDWGLDVLINGILNTPRKEKS